MKSRCSFALLAVLSTVGCIGVCGCDSKTKSFTSTTPPAAPPNSTTNSAANAAVTPPAQAAMQGGQAGTEQAGTDQGEVAKAGVGIKGRKLDDEQGIGKIIAQPAITLFAVRERVVFEIQIPQALQVYQAIQGEKPKTHEIFMKEVIKANQIKLPELPEGREYRYRPDLGELWVEPIQQN